MVYSMVILSILGVTTSINFLFFIPGCLLVHLNIIIQHRHQSKKKMKLKILLMTSVS